MQITNKQTRVYQPNKLTFAAYDYSLIQERIMNTVMYYLQEYIKPQFNASCSFNRDKFLAAIDDDYILIDFHPNMIVKPQQNDQLKDSLMNLATIPVELKSYNSKGELVQIDYCGLLSAKLILKYGRTSHIQISMKKEVACLLIELERNKNNQPINYTSFIYECNRAFKSKYSSRIYKMLSSWKSKRMYEVTLDDFRSQLKIVDSYKRYSDIKKNILLPAQRDLKKFADCWFDCEDETFVNRRNRRVYKLNFSIITKDDEKVCKLQKDSVEQLLKTYFALSQEDLKELEHLTNKPGLHARLNCKILEVYDRILGDYSIKDKKKYLFECILNEFPEQFYS